MKRILLSFLVMLLASGTVPAAAQTPVTGAVPADPFALPANHLILRMTAGNGFDYLRLDGGALAYVNGDLVDEGLSRVPVPQWLETWYTDMRVVDLYFSYVVMVPEDPGPLSAVIVDIRLLSFPDVDAAAAAVPGSFDVLQRQADEIPDASKEITLHPNPPGHDEAIIGVTGVDPSLNLATGALGEYQVPFSRFIAQDGAMVASIKVTSADAAFNDAVARELLAAQLACIAADAPCTPVSLPAGIDFMPATPVASPVAIRSRWA